MKHRSRLLPAAMLSVLAASTALTPLYIEQKWFWPSVLALLTAFGFGWLGRRLDVPGALAPALSMLGLVALLGLLFFRETTLSGLPTADTLREIGAALREAGSDIRERVPPTEMTLALNVLTTGGVYCVAALVDLIVFRVSRPALAGLPLLALYLVPASLNRGGPAVVPFVVAAAGYIGLLIAEGRDRARGWGRRLVGIEAFEDLGDASPVARVGRRLGAAAICTAIVIPVFVPTIGDGLLGGGGLGMFGQGSGSSRKWVINPIVDIKPRLQSPEVHELFTVKTATADYLRLTALDQFDGTIWAPSQQTAEGDQSAKSIPLPVQYLDPALRTITSTYEVKVGGLDVDWLPVQYFPSKVNAGKRWRYEKPNYSVFSSETTSRRKRYTATSILVEPTFEQLAGEFNLMSDPEFSRFLAQPGDMPKVVADTIVAVTGKAKTKYEKAVALQRYFRETGGYVYDLNVADKVGIDDINSFLVKRRGYCEQFAATMAYMARALGIPARVAIGFLPGRKGSDGLFHVTNKDAHAWPELYFPKTGWLRFEPTPTAQQPTTAPTYTLSTGIPGSSAGSKLPEPGTQDPAGKSPEERAEERLAAIDRRLDEGVNDPLPPAPSKPASRWPWLVLGLLGVVIVAASPGVAGVWLRSIRWRRARDDVARTHAVWRTLADTAEDVGSPLRASDSPRAAGHRLLERAELPLAAADGVRRLARAEERACYARDAAPESGLDTDLGVIREALFATLPRARRLRAQLLPPSVLRRAREAAVVGMDRLDRRQEAMWRGLRRRLTPRRRAA